MADSFFIEPMKRWLRRKIGNQADVPASATPTVGSDPLAQVRAILDTDQRSDNSGGITAQSIYGNPSTLVCHQCQKSYDIGSQFCDTCGIALSQLDADSGPVEASSSGGVTRVRLGDSHSGGEASVGGDISNVVQTIPSSGEQDDAVATTSPETVDSMTSNLRNLFTKTSVINQETKDLLERYGTVEMPQLVEELRGLTADLGIRSGRVR